MRALLVVLSLVALALSGCTDDPSAPDDGEPEPGVVTDPTDYSYLQNGTDGAGWHVHDYWGGQDTLEVLDKEMSCTNCFYQSSESARFANFRPGTDRVVPQGTALVHVTVQWNIQEGNHGAVGLWVKTANMSSPEFVAEVASGETVQINSTNDDNDPPHHRLSLWEFSVGALRADDQENVEVSGLEASVHVVAERGLPIPAYPPHPDLWQGATEITLLEDSRTVQYDIRATELGYLACSGCLGVHAPDDGLIVPYDAAVVEVVLEADPGSVPASLGLAYHGADSWDRSEVAPDEAEPLRWVWSLPLEGNADSPYAKQSLWEFAVTLDQPTPVQAWTGTYHITVTATK